MGYVGAGAMKALSRMSGIIVVALWAGSSMIVGLDTTATYSACQYTYVPGVSRMLEVFPISSAELRIPMPFPLGVLVYAPDGNSLYTTRLGVGAGLFRIMFRPLRTEQLAGSESIGVNSFAVAAKQSGRLAIAGGSGGFCGILEFNITDGSVRKVAQGAPCNSSDPKMQWSELYISPDGLRATALRRGRLELINMISGEVSAFPGNFVIATWSPDGRWIAAVGDGEDKTVLLDTINLKPQRAFNGQEITWSPDSRYLLGAKRSLTCGMEAGTFESVDVVSGNRREFASSRCLVTRTTLGWLGNDIARQ
jgi:hypothetical protein